MQFRFKVVKSGSLCVVAHANIWICSDFHESNMERLALALWTKSQLAKNEIWTCLQFIKLYNDLQKGKKPLSKWKQDVWLNTLHQHYELSFVQETEVWQCHLATFEGHSDLAMLNSTEKPVHINLRINTFYKFVKSITFGITKWTLYRRKGIKK